MSTGSSQQRLYRSVDTVDRRLIQGRTRQRLDEEKRVFISECSFSVVYIPSHDTWLLERLNPALHSQWKLPGVLTQ